jgi:hypothetical protein
VTHWIDKHAVAMYKARSYHHCKICKLGFLSMAMYATHFQKPYGKHPVNDKCKHFIALLIWNPSPSCVKVVRDGQSKSITLGQGDTPNIPLDISSDISLSKIRHSIPIDDLKRYSNSLSCNSRMLANIGEGIVLTVASS